MLILRGIVFIAAGIVVIFWDAVLPDYGSRKIILGCLIILYPIVRFIISLREDKKNNEE